MKTLRDTLCLIDLFRKYLGTRIKLGALWSSWWSSLIHIYPTMHLIQQSAFAHWYLRKGLYRAWYKTWSALANECPKWIGHPRSQCATIFLTTWLRVSSSSASSGFLELFLRSESQYLASSSGDLLEEFAILVTALLLMNLPQAWQERTHIFV